MQLINEKTASPARFSRTLFIGLGLLVLVISLPIMSHASFAASGASVSMSYTTGESGSTKYISVVITAEDSQFPKSVVVTLTSTYNGAGSPYNTQTVVVLTGSEGTVSQTFIVPFEGKGNYLFTGSISNPKGTVLVSATIDPHIEPEW